jgi:hypothetical protein
MTEAGFFVDTDLPFACQPGELDAAAERGSLLLLRVVNLMDLHEAEPDRSQERTEVRLDLMLHWLGMQLFGAMQLPAAASLKLAPTLIEWAGESLPAGARVLLSLHVHPAIAAPLRLAGRVVVNSAGRVEAELVFRDEALADAWAQWLFKRHRRAVHEARSRGG